MHTYIEVIKINIKNSVVYKIDTFIGILGNIFSLFVQIYLWRALLSQQSISEITLEEMITYQVIGILLGSLYNNSTASIVGKQVRDGSIAMELIKPYNFALSMFASSIAKSISDFILKGLPVLIFTAVTVKIVVSNLTITECILFIFVISINIFIYWLMHFIIGLLHFTLLNASWFIRILADIIRILGGGIIPLWFFPKMLKNVSLFLPFHLLYQFPQSIFIQKISNSEIVFNLVLSGIWIGILLITAFSVWVIGVKRLVIQGG